MWASRCASSSEIEPESSRAAHPKASATGASVSGCPTHGSHASKSRGSSTNRRVGRHASSSGGSAAAQAGE